MIRSSLRAAVLALGFALAAPALAQGTAIDPPAAVTVGDITVSGAFARATLPHAPVGGAFLTLTNKGTADDRLLAVSTPVAGTAQLHQMKMAGDVMQMSEQVDGIPVPAGATVTLSPGGFHIMLIDLKQPLVEGTTVPATLTFARAGAVEVQFPVGGIAAIAPAGGDATGGMAMGNGQ